MRHAAHANRSRFLFVRTQSPAPTCATNQDHDRERRLNLLVQRLPPRFQNPIRWLRRPSARWVRIPAGLLLSAGGVFAILPLLGLWMLPLGLVLLAEDIPPLRRRTDAALAWIERRRPHWMGLPRTTSSASRQS
jgi:hypothetical protein